ncbi:MAG: AAA family ATPase [Alphaproteobacteria bacterium]
MRLKTFHAPNLAAALEQVRQQLGPDAIIVATTEDGEGRGARVTAAMEYDDDALDLTDLAPPDAADVVCEALDAHATPAAINERLTQAVAELSVPEPLLALSAALDGAFRFEPLPVQSRTMPIMLVGPPGVGKTSLIAKLATQAMLGQAEVTLITTDTLRAGAVAQLQTYADRLNLPLAVAEDASRLAEIVALAGENNLVLIDSPGANPYRRDDVNRLEALLRVATIEPVLTLSAGRDAHEAADMAAAFSPLGVTRLAMTGFDLARRIGDALAAADIADLAFCNYSPGPGIADGLKAFSPLALARLLLSESDKAAHSKQPQAPRF